MLDPRLTRQELKQTAEKLRLKGFNVDVSSLDALEHRRKEVQTATEALQAKRNASAKEIGQAKAQGKDIQPLLDAAAAQGESLEVKKKELDEIRTKLDQILLSVPNLPHESVPSGKDETDNEIIKTWGDPPAFDFEPKDHVDLTAPSTQMNFADATAIAGARFVTLHGDLAKMHRALVQFMLDVHTSEHDYEEIYVPYIVNRESLMGTGQLPKFEEDLFKLKDERGFYLVPTSEVPVTNLARGKIIDAERLPMNFVCHSPCFRSEAGSYGKDTRGMIRQHQFEKVELVRFVKPEDSWDALETLTSHAEQILQKLGLPYRVVNLCGGDLGFAAAKTYDLEVWLPGQGKYREISSCSNCGDFQARRMQARWRNPATGKPELLHTLNGSALAVGRTLIAILENCQTADGQVRIPQCLQAYMSGKTRLELATEQLG